jgi:hypothetical protein
MPDTLDVYGQTVRNDFKIFEVHAAWACAVGLALCVGGMRKAAISPWLIWLSALLYLMWLYIQGAMRLVGPIQGFQLAWRTAKTFHYTVEFMIYDGALAAFFLLVLVAIPLTVLVRRR